MAIAPETQESFRLGYRLATTTPDGMFSSTNWEAFQVGRYLLNNGIDEDATVVGNRGSRWEIRFANGTGGAWRVVYPGKGNFYVEPV